MMYRTGRSITIHKLNDRQAVVRKRVAVVCMMGLLQVEKLQQPQARMRPQCWNSP